MTRILNGTVYVEQFVSTVNPGEYTFVDGIYNNQSDATGNGALDLVIDDLMYIQALDPISALLVPGVYNRYRTKGCARDRLRSWDPLKAAVREICHFRYRGG